MADGSTHAKLTGLSLVCLTLSSPYIYDMGGTPAVVGTLTGAVCGHYMTPDLDLSIRTYEEIRWLKKTPLFGRVWVSFWASYGEFFNHRGISHWWFIGTWTRIIWMLRHVILMMIMILILSGGGYIVINKMPLVDLAQAIPAITYFTWVLGWVWQDTIHLWLDGYIGFSSKRRKKAWSGRKRKLAYAVNRNTHRTTRRGKRRKSRRLTTKTPVFVPLR